MYGEHDFFGFGFGFMWIFWLLLILVIVWAVKSGMSAGSSDKQSEKSALQILEERYVRGEIDKNEFEQKKRDLTGGSGG